MTRAGTSICLIALTLAATACARPEEVRQVARLSRPIAVDLQRTGAQLDARMAMQAASADSYAATLAAQEARARTHAAQIERDFRLQHSENALRTLTIMREGDAALIADPLSPVAASAPPAATPRQALDLSALDAVIAGLDRLTREQRATAADWASLTRDFLAERAKLRKEGALDAPVSVTGAGTEP